MQHHERQQAHRLGLMGKERGQTAREAKGIDNEVTTHELTMRGRPIAFVEHEVEDVENGVEAGRERLAVGDLVTDVGAGDLLLRAGEALSDRRFVYPERHARSPRCSDPRA